MANLVEGASQREGVGSMVPPDRRLSTIVVNDVDQNGTIGSNQSVVVQQRTEAPQGHEKGVGSNMFLHMGKSIN